MMQDKIRISKHVGLTASIDGCYKQDNKPDIKEGAQKFYKTVYVFVRQSSARRCGR